MRTFCGQVHDGVSLRLLHITLCGADDSLRPSTNLVNRAVGPEARPAKANWKAHRDNRQGGGAPRAGRIICTRRQAQRSRPPSQCETVAFTCRRNRHQQTSAAEQPPAIMRHNPEIQPSTFSRMSNGDLNYTNRAEVEQRGKTEGGMTKYYTLHRQILYITYIS